MVVLVQKVTGVFGFLHEQGWSCCKTEESQRSFCGRGELHLLERADTVFHCITC